MALLAAFALVLAMAVPAFAASVAATGDNADSSSITIDGAVNGKTYTLYRIFDVASKTDDGMVYNVTTAWKSFFVGNGAGKDYVEIDSLGQVKNLKKEGFANDSENAKAFAAAALAWAKTQSKIAVASVTADNNGARFTDLKEGYYLVDTTTGSLCSVGNVTGSTAVTIKEKNGVPSVDKQVQENSDRSWGDKNDAEIGQEVNFKTTINVTAGNTTNYVLHDKMTGLTYKADSIQITKANGTVKLTEGTDYNIETPSDDCSFEIKFVDSKLNAGDVVVVTYTATVNANAVVAGTGNTNETWLDYGNDGHTTHDTTRTYVWEFKIYKYTKGAGESETVSLPGAEFVLYKKSDETKSYLTAKDNKLTGWTPEENSATKFTSDNNGNVSISGLDAGVYYLKETKAPDGYNKLTDDIRVELTKEYNESTNVGTAFFAYSNVTKEDKVEVENNAGTTLPSTGGMGTTVFYVVGGGLMAVAVVLLVTKKRMENKR
mgnify:FL=1